MSSPHPALRAAADAAREAYADARGRYGPAELAETLQTGADGTPSMRVDVLVEERIVAAVRPFGVNVLSEECGLIDLGSARTLVIDPVDGSANAAAGVPLSCFSGAVADEDRFTHALTAWLHTDDEWWAGPDGNSGLGVSGCRELTSAAVSLLRPHRRTAAQWWAVASAAARVRVLSCSTLDAALVATGATDAFVDAASDTHRLMDLVAACVLVPAAGGVVRDLWGRPIELDADLTRRWSGVVAASAELAEEIIEQIHATGEARPSPSVGEPAGRELPAG